MAHTVTDSVPAVGTVLAIDTATPAVVAGVLRREPDGTVSTLAQRITVDAHAHAELLTPSVVAVLSDAGVRMTELSAVVVGCGPGPFTGLRVGVATAAAYGHALGIPVFGVCTLDAIACRTAGEVLVVTDARRREVYWARYRDGERTGGPAVGAPGGLPAVADRIEFAHPTPAGLVAAVPAWDTEPASPVPLYLRRPDAKTLAERGLR